MKLADLLTAARRLKSIPNAEIHGLIGELEALKPRLWVRLIEPEEAEPLVVERKDPASAK